jgi:signal transduction histidine kinase
MVQEAVLVATPMINGHGVRVKTVMDDDMTIWGDAGMLRQVVLNLVLNAVQAMPDGGDLCINCAGLAPDRVALRITDTGTGINPIDRPRLFDPFFTTRPDGTGLGLAIAHNIVLAHGGAIDVESEAGKGTTFTIILSKEKGAQAIHGTAPTF